METHSREGERERYFADDDRYDLKEMVRREKMRTAEDHNAMMARLSSKVNRIVLHKFNLLFGYFRQKHLQRSLFGLHYLSVMFQFERCVRIYRDSRFKKPQK